MRSALLGLLFLALVSSPSRAGSAVSVDPRELEAVEELTEAIANDLLEFSVALRKRDTDDAGRYLADPVKARPFPPQPGPLVPRVKWIAEHGWNLDAASERTMPRAAFVASLARFLDHFAQIDDVRFQVKESSILAEAGNGSGQFKFFIVGRDVEGRREWVRGSGAFAAQRVDRGAWQLKEFVLDSVGSQLASSELFSEVGANAGVEQIDPPFAVGPGSRFTSHGAAATDANGDGLVDVFATGPSGNFLYLNQGDGAFSDVSLEAGVKHCASIAIAPLFLDYDNDGDADLFISSVGFQMLFQNRLIPDGRLIFSDVSEQAGVSTPAVGFSAAAADVNKDGFTDIYVASYNHYGEIAPDAWDGASNGTPNLLFINQKNGTFREVARLWGVDDRRWSYATAMADVDGDGDQDIYVANDFGGGNALFLNQMAQGTSRFLDAAEQRGVLDRGYGMGVSFGDYDNDGDLDLHVTQMSSTAGNRILKRLFPDSHRSSNLLLKLASGNSLFESLGEGRFRDVSDAAGGFPAGWAWGGGFVDFDNDGWEDLYVPNGFISGKSMKDT